MMVVRAVVVVGEQINSCSRGCRRNTEHRQPLPQLQPQLHPCRRRRHLHHCRRHHRCHHHHCRHHRHCWRHHHHCHLHHPHCHRDDNFVQMQHFPKWVLHQLGNGLVGGFTDHDYNFTIMISCIVNHHHYNYHDDHIAVRKRGNKEEEKQMVLCSSGRSCYNTTSRSTKSTRSHETGKLGISMQYGYSTARYISTRSLGTLRALTFSLKASWVRLFDYFLSLETWQTKEPGDCSCRTYMVFQKNGIRDACCNADIFTHFSHTLSS